MMGTVVALLLLTVAPPARGAMLLLPLDAAAREHLAALAIANGASLLKAGPLPHSLIVSGDRDSLLMPLGRRHVLVLAASSFGCGGEIA